MFYYTIQVIKLIRKTGKYIKTCSMWYKLL